MSNPVSHTLATLTAALQGFEEDTGAEFTASINTIIQLGEARLATDMNLEIFDTVVTAALTSGVREQAIKPAGHQGLRSFHIRDAGGTGPLRKLARRTYEFCVEFAPLPTTQAEPIYFAEYSPTQFYLVPTPNAAYQAVLRQIVAPPSLVTASPTWIGTNLGDVLFYACIVASEQYLKGDDSFHQRWKTTYDETMAMRRFELRDVLRGDYNPMKNAGSTVEARP